MAGGHMKYRTLGRDSAHRKALLRNMVTSLVKLESIQTTYAKAKEAQRMADKLITLAKRNNETARRAAQGILFTPDQLLPKLFGELRERYADRPGGYTRVLRIEPINRHYQDQAESAILEFVDGKVDTRFAMTAAAVARARSKGYPLNPITRLNLKKVTQFRPGGRAEFKQLVQAIQEHRPTQDGRGIDHADTYVTKRAERKKRIEEERLRARQENVDEYREEDFDIKEPGEGGEGRGARQRRRRREEAALRDEAENDSGWEDMEDADEFETKPISRRSADSRGKKQGVKPTTGRRHLQARAPGKTDKPSF